jgi:hypothetical protein
MRSVIFEAIENFNQNFVSRIYRKVGKQLYELGNKLEG